MVDFLTLPWWAYGYAFLLCGMTIGGFVTDKELTPAIAVGHTLTVFVSIVCILVYCQPVFARQLGVPLLLSMILYAMAWDFSQSVKDANRIESEMKQDASLTDNERSAIMNSGLLLGAALILPAYMMGLKVCYDLFTGAI